MRALPANETLPIILIPRGTYYSQNYSRIIDAGLPTGPESDPQSSCGATAASITVVKRTTIQRIASVLECQIEQELKQWCWTKGGHTWQ